jgi:hypothetical protein
VSREAIISKVAILLVLRDSLCPSLRLTHAMPLEIHASKQTDFRAGSRLPCWETCSALDFAFGTNTGRKPLLFSNARAGVG